MTEKAKDQLTEKEQLEGKIAGIKKEIDDLKNVVDLDEKQIGMESIEKKILDLQQEIEATTLVDSEKQELIIFLENSSGELTDLKSEVIENSVDESQIEEQKPEEEKKNFFGRSRDWIKGSWVGRHPWWSAGMAAVAGWGIWRIFKKSDKEDEKNN
ncbi:MAG: hypothetical protein LBI53_04100 [Candidatus Peribacteria bacterium]|jgi:ElaB/YqjD/DUF883 family membrane-anchored ribosome-binding protein|nr:hypothetical protein [Candidatus Peribacteria bacterium]